MKKTTLLHAELSGLIAALGHGDLVVIGDAGLPVPPGVRVIDLALTRGIPGVFDVLDTVLAEMTVERASLAHETAPELAAQFEARQIGPVTRLSHAAFKDATRDARAIIRTGEFTPYANIALYAGVAF